MKAGRKYTDEQILAFLQEHQGGVTAKEVIRRYGISLDTLYRWKRKYSGVDQAGLRGSSAWSPIRRSLSSLEGRVGKRVVMPQQRRAVVIEACTRRALPVRRACRSFGIHRSLLQYASGAPPQDALRVRLGSWLWPSRAGGVPA